MMNKFLGIILASIFSVILIVQTNKVGAQLADEPITGPITSPLTGPMLSPTVTPSGTPTMTPTTTPTETPTETLTPTPSVTMTPTPTLIETITTTPIPTMTETPTPTMTPTMTPTPAVNTRLGGLDLDSYCKNTNHPGLLLQNNTWFCDNGASQIDLTKVCQVQFDMTNVVALQDIAGNPWSWSCYVTAMGATPTPTMTPMPTVIPTETPTMMPTETVTPTPSEEITPTTTESVTPTATVTSTPTENPVHTKHVSHFSFLHFPKGFPFIGFVNAEDFFRQPHVVHHATITAKTCSIHDLK